MHEIIIRAIEGVLLWIWRIFTKSRMEIYDQRRLDGNCSVLNAEGVVQINVMKGKIILVPQIFIFYIQSSIIST